MNEEQEKQLRRLKQYFPYRIVYAVVMPNGEFKTYADVTKRKMNSFLRKGYQVYTLQS